MTTEKQLDRLERCLYILIYVTFMRRHFDFENVL